MLPTCMLLTCMLLVALPATFAQPQQAVGSDLPGQPMQAGAHMPVPPGALVRLRFVKGHVSILQGTKVEFPQAHSNMPVLSGSTLETGEDGQAEIEFSDGSVARLTPQTRLRLVRLPAGDADRNGATNLELLSGLCYFELNTTQPRRYSVRFSRALAQPTENSIFRIDLDPAPELAVFLGALQARADGGFDQYIEQGESLHLARAGGREAPPEPVLSQKIREDSWDRWNQDRDETIAAEASQQTAASEQSSAAGQAGWNELDEYGDWYPTEQYGNVWMPADVGEGWDPYSSGYWANYPGWGYTWISSYPWGWLPYQCGAWNYWNSVGWGWIPGGCGWGAQPVVTIWNAPPAFHLPPRPIPGGHTGAPTLVAVHRGPSAPANGLLSNNHTRPVRIDGQRLYPLPILERPRERLITGQSYQQTGRVGVPLPMGSRIGAVLSPGSNARTPAGSGVSVWPRGAGVRPPVTGNGSNRSPGPTGSSPSRIEPLGPPAASGARLTPAPPGMGVPRVGAPSLGTPHISAPTVTAPSAPHASPSPSVVTPAPAARPH